MPAPYWIEPYSKDYEFPDVRLALRDPDGLLAIGGDLSLPRLLSAYRSGIFPWYSENQPLLWWSPDPRFVLFPEQLKISRSLRKTLRNKPFRITINQCFEQVIASCKSTPRPDQDGTWITTEMIQAYQELHKQGYAHSVECWLNDQLVGGLYGVSLGKVFFGESMFSTVNDASKVAFAQFVSFLQSRGVRLIDCQVYTPHLESLGACAIPREEFITLLSALSDTGQVLETGSIELPEKQ